MTPPDPFLGRVTADVRFVTAGRRERGLLLELLHQNRVMADPTRLAAAAGRTIEWTVGWLTRSPDDPADPAEAVGEALRALRKSGLAAFDDGGAELLLPACVELQPTALPPSGAVEPGAPAVGAVAPPAAGAPWNADLAEVQAQSAAAAERRRMRRAGQVTELAGFTVNRNTARAYASLFRKAKRDPSCARKLFADAAAFDTFEAWLATPRGLEWLKINGRPCEESERVSGPTEVAAAPAPVAPASPASPMQPAAPRSSVVPPPERHAAGCTVTAETFVHRLHELLAPAERRHFAAKHTGGAQAYFALDARMRRAQWTDEDHATLAAYVNAGGLDGLTVPHTAVSLGKEGTVENLRERARRWQDSGGRPMNGRRAAPAPAPGIVRGRDPVADANALPSFDFAKDSR